MAVAKKLFVVFALFALAASAYAETEAEEVDVAADAEEEVAEEAFVEVDAEGETETEGEADAEAEIPTLKPRKGAKLGAVTSFPSYGRHIGTQRVVTVPKGDPRARPAPGERVHHHHHHHHRHHEPRVVVEAEEVQPAPRHHRHHRHHHHHHHEHERAEKRHHKRHHRKPEVHIYSKPSVRPAAPLLKAGAPTTAADACLRAYNGAAVAAKATAYQIDYKRRGVVYDQSRREFGANAKYSDCSSFVTSILSDTGFDCLFNAGRYTAYMNQQIKARGGYKQTAKVGDLVMWGSHTGLITKVCSPTTYTMVAMGLSGAGLATCKTVAQLKAWGSGGWLGFWSPHALGSSFMEAAAEVATVPMGPTTCLANYSGAKVGAAAAALQAKYKKAGVKYSQPKRQFGDSAKFSDCSSFVNTVLADTGYDCIFNAATLKNTASMNAIIKTRGGYSKTAKVGDLVMWGGHTGIVTKVCSKTTFSMVAMGLHGAGLANCLTNAGIAKWGSGGFLGYWTPH